MTMERNNILFQGENLSDKKRAEKLKEELGYNGNLTKEIRVKTYIQIVKKRKKLFGGYEYTIKFR